MNRRDFIKGSTIILLGAPAIVRAESLMKIWVDPHKFYRPQYTMGYVADQDYTWLLICRKELDANKVILGDWFDLIHASGDVRLNPAKLDAMFRQTDYLFKNHRYTHYRIRAGGGFNPTVATQVARDHEPIHPIKRQVICMREEPAFSVFPTKKDQGTGQ